MVRQAYLARFHSSSICRDQRSNSQRPTGTALDLQWEREYLKAFHRQLAHIADVLEGGDFVGHQGCVELATDTDLNRVTNLSSSPVEVYMFGVTRRPLSFGSRPA